MSFNKFLLNTKTLFQFSHPPVFVLSSVWVSPVFPTLPAGSGPRDGDSKTGFKRDLLEYLRAYKQHHLEEWIRIIGGHDMSSSQ